MLITKKYLVEALFSIGFIVAAAILNLQFLEGANINFVFSGHDEYLTVREVYAILNPPTIKHFFMAVVSGNVLYYGKMMFYADALFAALPYKIWGVTGMVYAIRMAHVIFLLLGVVLLSATFLKKNASKFIFLASVLTLYYTAYFVVIPKPEPLQVLLIAVFLKFAMNRNWAFGKHFIILGMAYGMKFNVLTILPLFFILPFVTGSVKWKNAAFSVLYFVGGILIAVPCLILGPFKPVFIKAYLKSTFGNTSHADDTFVSFFNWVEKGWFNNYLGGIIFGLIVIALIIFMFIRAYKWFMTEKKIDNATIVLLTGLGLMLPVMLFTKRLWPHYLWTGNLFILLALCSFMNIESIAGKLKLIFNIGMWLIFVGFITASIQKNSDLFRLEKNMKTLITDGKIAYQYIKRQRAELTCIQDISVYYPFTEFVKVERYHPFASQPPFRDPGQKFQWATYINPDILKKEKADFLIVNKRDFGKVHQGAVSLNDKLISRDDSLMKFHLGKAVVLDTIIGEVKVYRVFHDQL